MQSDEVTVITLTGDRPVAFAHCQEYVQRQTIKPAEWIVIDDGKHAATPATFADKYVQLEPAPNPTESFRRNLEHAMSLVRTPIVAFMEDDDWYSPHYLEFMLALGSVNPIAGVVGECCAKYYNVRQRRYRVMQNREHASLASTVLTTFDTQDILKRILRSVSDFSVDIKLWNSCPDDIHVRIPLSTHSVQLKGIVGRPGLGVGHRAQVVRSWDYDRKMRVLSTWIGRPDADRYRAEHADGI